MYRGISGVVAAILLLLHDGQGFQATPVFQQAVKPDVTAGSTASSTALFMAKSRKARRMQKVEKQGKNRPAFMDAIEDSGKNVVSPPDDDDDEPNKSAGPDPDPEREARAEEARKRMEERPDVSTMIIDDETGIEIVAQGKAVMDVVTRKAVSLSKLGPEYRMAEMFPGVPPNVRESSRFDWKTAEVPQMVGALREACSAKLADGSVGIPSFPSVASTGIDFVIANRDHLGYKMKRTLGRLQMRSMWKGNVEEATEYQKLWKNFLTLENHISAPFRQMIMDGEGRVGPQFGNLDLMSFCDGEQYERVANYLVLKGMAAHWEKKLRDANFFENTPQTKENSMSVIATGDPKRYLPDPPILYTLRECTQVCVMAQQMCKAFVETEALFNDFPPEIRFLETALTIKGGTPLRKYMIEEFCPVEGITPEGLREGMRRFHEQISSMQLDPYGDLTNVVSKLIGAMSVGTDDERDPYAVYLGNTDPDGPGYFQTYTFNHDKQSLVRFFDSQYETSGSLEAPQPMEMELPDFFNFGAKEKPKPKPAETSEGETYRVPSTRAAGRPHDLGWLDLLEGEKDENLRLGKVPPGQIIS